MSRLVHHHIHVKACASSHSCQGLCIITFMSGLVHHHIHVKACASSHSCEGLCIITFMSRLVHHHIHVRACASSHSCQGLCIITFMSRLVHHHIHVRACASSHSCQGLCIITFMSGLVHHHIHVKAKPWDATNDCLAPCLGSLRLGCQCVTAASTGAGDGECEALLGPPCAGVPMFRWYDFWYDSLLDLSMLLCSVVQMGVAKLRIAQQPLCMHSVQQLIGVASTQSS
jgi:hypothetical protein